MNLVAIVGRPNVGKSTLFNRLVGRREAIVESEPGVTRDRLYGHSTWNGKDFIVIDTGGFIPGSESTMERAIREQAMIAIEEAQSIIFVCDGNEGVTKFDEDIAQILRSSQKPITLVINKCDNESADNNSYEFYKLGLGDPFPLSALNGRSTGDFLDHAVEPLEFKLHDEEDNRLKIAVLGRPNAGKSSIVNAFYGEERMIVTDIPGTTRDSIDTVIKYYGEEIVLIDTAGLRKRSHVKENIELYSILRTSRAIERCDVAIVLVDAERGIEEQDKKIINQVDKNRKGIILAINKWDLVDKNQDTAPKIRNDFYAAMKTYDYVPVQFVSALTKQRIWKLIDLAKEIKNRANLHIKTSDLNKKVIPLLEKTPPPSVKGNDLRINYITQVNTNPPVFAIFCNYPHLLPDAYKRFIERSIRSQYELEGTTISLIFRRKNVKWEERDK